MTAIPINPRIVALAVFGAIASFGAQAQTTEPVPAPASTNAAASMSNSAAITAGATGGQASAAAIEGCTAKATTLLDALDKGDYADAGKDFSDQVRAGAPADKLKAVWESMPQRFGARGARGAPQNSASDGYIVITVPMPFQNGNLAAQVACGADGKIAGFHVMTVPQPERQPAVPTTPAPASTAVGH